MPIVVVSSLDVVCRQLACERLQRARPASVVVLHDLQEQGVVLRRVYRGGRLVERKETPLDHGCLSCAVRLDVAPTVARLHSDGEDDILVGLPPGVRSVDAVEALKEQNPAGPGMASVVLACSPGAVEDQVWDGHTLFESGFTPSWQDDRTPGEFLIGELAFCDTVLMSDPVFTAVSQKQRERGTQLLRELSPHAAVIAPGEHPVHGRHDAREARSRLVPGSVRIPVSGGNAPFRTVLHRACRPLHPERFRDALPALAAGSCWLRGRIWVGSAPRCRIAIQGIGPRVWMESTGWWAAEGLGPDAGRKISTDAALDWHPEFGDRGSVLAITGDWPDADAIMALIDGCQLTDAEMAGGLENLPDPFGFAEAASGLSN
jgi:G3E family GTPase